MTYNIDPIWIWVAVAVVAVLIIGGLIAGASRRARSSSLRERFGSEYDRAVSEAGSRRRGEDALLARSEEVDRFTIRPLTAAERDRYRADWRRIEERFLERPASAVVEADEMVADIMRIQGYPMGDFERHAAHLSVKHPRVIEHYREGHQVLDKAGSASTEDLRQAMLHYRTLFDELIGDRSDDVATDIPRANEVPMSGTRRAEERPLSEPDRDVSTRP